MNQTENTIPSGADDIRHRLQDELIERVLVLMRRTLSASVRLQVPRTDIQIIAGPESWLRSQICDQSHMRATMGGCEAAEQPTGDLTDEQIEAIWNRLDGKAIIAGEVALNWNAALRKAFARAIESAASAAHLARQSQAAQPSGDALELVQRMRARAELDSLDKMTRCLFLDAAMMVEYLAGQSQATKAQAVPEGLSFDGYHDSDEHYGKTILDLVRARLEADPADMATGDTFYVSAAWVQPQEWRVVFRNGGTVEVERVSPPVAAPTAQEVTQQAAPDEYGDTEFGYTFAGVHMEEGDKRLAAMLVKALGTAHPAMDDFVSLVFRARSAPVTQQAAKAELHDDLQQTVSDFRKATYEFARGQDPEDHAAMMAAQKRIFDIAGQLAVSAAKAETAEQALDDAENAIDKVMSDADDSGESAEAVGAYRCLSAIQALRAAKGGQHG